MNGRIGDKKDLSFFLLKEDIENLEKGNVLKSAILYKENGEEVEIPVKFKRANRSSFIDVRPLLLKNFFEIESIKISLNKDAINYLKHGRGMINYGETYVYSPQYEYFDILYNSPK